MKTEHENLKQMKYRRVDVEEDKEKRYLKWKWSQTNKLNYNIQRQKYKKSRIDKKI